VACSFSLLFTIHHILQAVILFSVRVTNMTGNQIECWFLRCSHDVILHILEACQPRDFEALMLTCKDVFNTGRFLIENHNYCKKWLKRKRWANRPSGHAYLGDVWKILDLISEEKAPKRQMELLSRLQKVEWGEPGDHRFPERRGPYRYFDSEGSDIEVVTPLGVYVDEDATGERNSEHSRPDELQMLEICNKMPWVQKCMSRILGSYVASRSNQSIVSDANSSTLLPSAKSIKLTSESLSDLLGSRVPAYKASDFLNGLAALFISNGLTSLVMRHYPTLEGSPIFSTPILSDVLASCSGKIYFQNLQFIHIMRHKWKSYSAAHIIPFMMLPRLKTLIVENVTSYSHSKTVPDEIGALDQLENRVLDKLVLLKADVDPSCINRLLNCLKVLQTFIMEQDTPHYSRLGVTKFPKANSNISSTSFFQKHAWTEFIPYGRRILEDEESETQGLFNSEKITGKDPANECLEAEFEAGDPSEQFSEFAMKHLVYYRMEELRFWNPTELLYQLHSHHRDRVQHLALMCFRNNVPLCSRRGYVQHFRDFVNLTHLEFDVRILRPKRTKVSRHYDVWPSLASVLPQSIEVVRVIFVDPREDLMRPLLGELPQHVTRLPHLKKIRIVVHKNPQVQCDYRGSGYMESEMNAAFESVLTELHARGLDMSFEAVDCIEGTACPRPNLSKADVRKSDDKLWEFWDDYHYDD
jgi:hypothetical protein